MKTPVTIMPRLDMSNGRVVKGVKFVRIRDAGDPVECCKAYCEAGADAIAMFDISATIEERPTMLDVVRRVAEVATVPLTVGGGIVDLKSAALVLEAGADKISISSAVFRKPVLIRDTILELGADRVTIAIDVGRSPGMPCGYEVYLDGGRTATGKDAVEWLKRIESFGAKTILPTNKSTDGVRGGYDLPLIRAIKGAVSGDVIAAGGAGTLEHFHEAVAAGATILLAASVFHFGLITIKELKQSLRGRRIGVK